MRWLAPLRHPGLYYNPRTGIFNLRNTLSHGHYAVSFHFGPTRMIPLAGVWFGG